MRRVVSPVPGFFSASESVMIELHTEEDSRISSRARLSALLFNGQAGLSAPQILSSRDRLRIRIS